MSMNVFYSLLGRRNVVMNVLCVFEEIIITGGNVHASLLSVTMLCFNMKLQIIVHVNPACFASELLICHFHMCYQGCLVYCFLTQNNQRHIKPLIQQ